MKTAVAGFPGGGCVLERADRLHCRRHYNPRAGLMNGKERMRIAMDLGRADRIPYMCQLAVGHYFLHSWISPVDIWFRSEGFAEALIALQRRYRFDGILVNLPGRDPDFERHVARIEMDPQQRATCVRWKGGGTTVIPHDDNPHYLGPDGRRFHPRWDEVEPEQLYYVEPWDLAGITYPSHWSFETEQRSEPEFFPAYHLDTIHAVIERTRGEVSVHGEVFSPFSQFLELFDYQVALLALVDDPGKCHACLARMTEGATFLAQRQLDAGVDAVLVSSAFAGAGFISRAMYEEFVLPYERELITEVQSMHPSAVLYTHTCGAIGDRLDLMLEAGTAGIDTLDPPPLGTVDIASAVELLNGKAFIKGNLDPVNTLLHGSAEEIEEAVHKRIAIAGPGGGYILSSACSVSPRVEPRVLERVGKIVREYGVYGG